MKRRNRRHTGFTVIEILISVVVLTMLISLLLPAIQQSRESARATQCRNNLLQIGIAMMSYHDVHECLPPGCVNRTSPVPIGYRPDLNDHATAEPNSHSNSVSPELKQQLGLDTDWYRISWFAQILPQLDNRQLFREIDFQDPRKSFLDKNARADFDQQLANHAADDNFQMTLPTPQAVVNPLLWCPSRTGATTSATGIGISHYSGCYDSRPIMIQSDNNGLLFLNSSIAFANIADGRSHTLLVGESGGILMDSGFLTGDFSMLRNTATPPPNVYSMKNAQPNTEPLAWYSFSSPHSTIINLLMADGSVSPTSLQIDTTVFHNLGSRNDWLPLSQDP